jgi:hypothetical protein
VVSAFPVINMHLYSITERDGVMVNRQDGSPFDAASYSRFKYGDTAVAKDYGMKLAFLLRDRLLKPALKSREPVVFTASAYKVLPTAARAVAQAMYEQTLADGYKVEAGRIHRANLTNGDYATMSAHERKRAMSENGIYFDKAVFHGRHVVVIDDVKITGSHERSIHDMFDGEPILSLTHVYVVEMDPEIVKVRPSVEDTLNHTWMNGIDRLCELILAGGDQYPFNARTAKAIFSASSHQKKQIWETLGNEQILELHRGAHGDGYNVMHAYASGFAELESEMQRRGIALP